MSDLTDDELNSFLTQARECIQPPSAELELRVMRAYRANRAQTGSWHWALLRPVSIPWPFAILISLLLFLGGLMADRGFHRMLLVQPAPTLTFREFRPVSEIRPHVIRSLQDEQ